MENNKKFLILSILFIIACSIIHIPSNGWEYLYINDVENAHKEFLRDYAYDQTIENTSGLAYTYFLLSEFDSSNIYIKKCVEKDSLSNYTFFVFLLYNHFFNIQKADNAYKLFVNTNGVSIEGFLIDSTISLVGFHKMGLISEYDIGHYDYAYSILQSITNIDKNLNMEEENNRIILLDYINSLEDI